MDELDEYNENMREQREAYGVYDRINLSRENFFDQLTRSELNENKAIAEDLFNQLSEFFDTIPPSNRRLRRAVLNDINLVERVIDKIIDYTNIQGNGFFKRDLGKFPPKMRNNLKKFGDEVIETLTLFRLPMPEVKFLVKLVSGGRVPYDKLWHLGIKVNNKYYIDKDAVWTFKKLPLPSEKKIETFVVTDFKEGVTIKEWLEQTAKRVGKERFYKYTALKNNCQRAMMDLLITLGVNEREYKDFILQDTNLIKSKLPSWSEGMADLFNSAKEIVNRQIEGEGHGEYKGEGDIYDFLFLDKEKIRRARERQGFTKIKGKGVDEPILLF